MHGMLTTSNKHSGLHCRGWDTERAEDEGRSSSGGVQCPGSSCFILRDIETQKRTVQSEWHDKTHPWKRLFSPFHGK